MKLEYKKIMVNVILKHRNFCIMCHEMMRQRLDHIQSLPHIGIGRILMKMLTALLNG